jgi:hypothetical protein
MVNRYLGIGVVVLGLMPLISGCGFDAVEIATDLRLSFNINGAEGEFEQEQNYKPDDNPDIKSHRDKLADSVIRIRDVTIQINSIGDKNKADFVWAKVYAYPVDKPLDRTEIEKDKRSNCEESLLAAACFEAGSLSEGKELHLDMTPTQKANLVDLVFNHPELTVKFIGWSDHVDEPVEFQADLVLSIEATAGLF